MTDELLLMGKILVAATECTVVFAIIVGASIFMQGLLIEEKPFATWVVTKHDCVDFHVSFEVPCSMKHFIATWPEANIRLAVCGRIVKLVIWFIMIGSAVSPGRIECFHGEDFAVHRRARAVSCMKVSMGTMSVGRRFHGTNSVIWRRPPSAK